MLTIKTNQDKKLFILFLIIKCFNIKTTHLHITSIGLNYKNDERLRRVYDWWRHLRKHIGTNVINYFLN